MSKYILSIDPSIKDTGFVLWSKVYLNDKYDFWNWKPILVNNYSFEKFKIYDFDNIIAYGIMQNNNIDATFNNLDIYIERGFNSPLNARSSEIMSSLRGNIFGLFNKLYIPKKHGILPKKWQNWYRKLSFLNTLINDKWDKDSSIRLAKAIIEQNNWNIDIKNNHNITDALLIGWYVINNNKEKYA